MVPPVSMSAAPPSERVEFETPLSDISARLIAVDSAGVDEAMRSALDAVRPFRTGDDANAFLGGSGSLEKARK